MVRRAAECAIDLTNSWPTRQGALEQTTLIRGIPGWAEMAGPYSSVNKAGSSWKECDHSLNAELNCEGRDCRNCQLNAVLAAERETFFYETSVPNRCTYLATRAHIPAGNISEKRCKFIGK